MAKWGVGQEGVSGTKLSPADQYVHVLKGLCCLEVYATISFSGDGVETEEGKRGCLCGLSRQTVTLITA